MSIWFFFKMLYSNHFDVVLECDCDCVAGRGTYYSSASPDADAANILLLAAVDLGLRVEPNEVVVLLCRCREASLPVWHRDGPVKQNFYGRCMKNQVIECTKCLYIYSFLFFF
jgi:hypothetical protein